jgi:hypothetical protein
MTGRKSNRLVAGVAVAVAAILMTACGKEKTPNRDYIPQLRTSLNNLQIAVMDRNRAQIDSMLSVQILDIKEDSDSLLKFIYGPDGDYAFERFGDAEIFYTDNKARIDAYIMDSTAAKDRPVTFTLVREHGMWLLKRFEPRSDTVKSVAKPG